MSDPFLARYVDLWQLRPDGEVIVTPAARLLPVRRGTVPAMLKVVTLEEAKRGSEIFFFTGRCATCHAGFNFSDGRFYSLGIGWDTATQRFKDEGRFAISHDPRDRGAFKTPGLREVSKHAPYMHDGSLATLRGVVEFYNRGGAPDAPKSGRIRPIGLNPRDIDALVAFLQSLEGEGYQDQSPKHFPR